MGLDTIIYLFQYSKNNFKIKTISIAKHKSRALKYQVQCVTLLKHSIKHGYAMGAQTLISKKRKEKKALDLAIQCSML